MKRIRTSVFKMVWIPFICLSCSANKIMQDTMIDLTRFVNPYIGSEQHGHVFVGANVPFGAIQAGPSNIMQKWDKFQGWDWCSGYNYISREILGFTHTHLSGTGIGDLNDILLLPANGPVQLNPMSFGNMNSGYGSPFSHDRETVSPGYYQVYLDKYKVNVELTASERAGFHQYKFEKTDNAHLFIDLSFGMGWDAPVDTYIKKINDSTFSGYRFSTGWAKDQRVFFAIRTSRPITRSAFYDSTMAAGNSEVRGRQVKATLFFNVANDPWLKVKVGLSPVSSENALANIDAEIPGWNFKRQVALAKEKWNAALGRIEIKTDPESKIIFYTALYHSLFAPNLFNDSNGEYRGADRKAAAPPGFNNYTVFSLWDIYRAQQPLMALIQPGRINDIVNTFLNIYRQQGTLPVWHLEGNETNTMIGYPAVPVIVGAYLKGFRNYNVPLAYEAVKHSAMQQVDGLQYLQQLKFIPADSVTESVAKTLEYAFSDWCIAQMARALGKQNDYDYFMKRGSMYTACFDTTTGFMRGRVAENKWRMPFNPVRALHREDDYTEGNAWQYTWLVPQDVEGLIALLGGDKKFINKLDSLFSISSMLEKGASPDISGMIGQYAHGNEPGHHIAYLYSYAGQPWKTARMVRQIADTFYTNRTDGLCGNDDAGQLSSWYIFSALGFYPVNPVNGAYVFGSPLVNDAVIKTGDKRFHLLVMNNSKNNKYIQKAILNGKPYTRAYLMHADIVKGGELILYMSDRPSATWGIQQKDRPVSFIDYK